MSELRERYNKHLSENENNNLRSFLDELSNQGLVTEAHDFLHNECSEEEQSAYYESLINIPENPRPFKCYTIDIDNPDPEAIAAFLDENG